MRAAHGLPSSGETCLTITCVEGVFVAAAPFHSLNYDTLHSRPSESFVDIAFGD